MKNFSVITLRPHKKTDRKEFNEFRGSDIASIAVLFAIVGILHVVLLITKYIVTGKNPDEVIAKFVAYSIAWIGVSILRVSNINR